jgi:hypothetical protein
MKPDPFDALVRRHIQEEAFMIHPDFEKRLAQKLSQPEVLRSARRISVRSLALAMALLMFLTGAALAASGWGSRLFLTREDEDGNPIVNEELVALAQPIGQVFERDRLRVEIIDAIYDGQYLVLTWTLQNKQTEGDIFVLAENIRQGESYQQMQGTFRQMTEVLLKPGETIESGMSTLWEARGDADTLDIRFDYVVMTPEGELVPMNYPYDLEGEAFQAAYEAEIARIEAEGNIAVAPDGSLEFSDKKIIPFSRNLSVNGKMELEEIVQVRLSIPRNAAATSLLPDGQPVEKDNGDYILRVTQANITPGMAHFMLERVFKTREAMEKYADYYYTGGSTGLFWAFSFESTDGAHWYRNGVGYPANTPEEQPDGTWVWLYEATMGNLQSIPDSITIIPTRDEAANPGEFIPHPEEGITLTK